MKHKMTRAAVFAATLALAGGGFAATADKSDSRSENKTESKAQDKSASKKGEPGKPAAGPILLLVPVVVAIDDKLGNGCWARLYDKENYGGNVSVLVGPIDVATARPVTVTGFELGRNYDSVVVGPNATLTVWDNEQYRNKTATFKAGQKVPNLDNKMGYFEEIKSLKLTCTK